MCTVIPQFYALNFIAAIFRETENRTLFSRSNLGPELPKHIRLVTWPRVDSENSSLFSVSRKMAAICGWRYEFKGRFWDRKSTSFPWNHRERLDIYRLWKVTGQCRGMSGFKLLSANFLNWGVLAFRNLLSYLVFLLLQYRRLKGKSHVRLLETLRTPKKQLQARF